VSVTASAGMDCNGLVTVSITDNSPTAFHGQSATASAWIVTVNLAPGESTSVSALFASQPSVDGFVQGRLDGDPTFINVAWHAARACPVPTTAPRPVDTTPQPIPTTAPGQVQMCIQPGSNPPLAVPCDDPRATTPYQPPVTASQPPSDAQTPPTTATDPSQPVQTAPGAVQRPSGPPRTAHVTTVATVSTAKPVTALPSTGTSPVLGIGGSLILVAGIALCALGRRRHAV
jgi:hypothetical protein